MTAVPDVVATLDDLDLVCADAGLPETSSPVGMRRWAGGDVTVTATGGSGEYLTIDVVTCRTYPTAGWYSHGPRTTSAAVVRAAIADIQRAADTSV